MGPAPPYTLQYRQQSGLILFTLWLVVLTTIVALLLMNMQLRIQRRQRLAASLLPFYKFFRVDSSWRNFCATYPQLALVVTVYIGYVTWRSISVNFLLMQASSRVVRLGEQELFQRNSTCTLASGERTQVAMLLDLNTARRAVGGAGTGGDAAATWASIVSFLTNSLPLFVSILIPQIQRLLALDNDGDALAAVRLKGFVHCTEGSEHVHSGAGAAGAAAADAGGSSSGGGSSGGGCKHHAVVLTPGSPPSASPRAQAQQQQQQQQQQEAEGSSVLDPSLFQEVEETPLGAALWETIMEEASPEAGSSCLAYIMPPLVARVRFFVWPWPSLQQCSARRRRAAAAGSGWGCAGCCRCHCPKERDARAAHEKEVGILLATLKDWKAGKDCNKEAVKAAVLELERVRSEGGSGSSSEGYGTQAMVNPVAQSRRAVEEWAHKQVL